MKWLRRNDKQRVIVIVFAITIFCSIFVIFNALSPYYNNWHCYDKSYLPASCSCGLPSDLCIAELGVNTDVSIRPAPKLIWFDSILHGYVAFNTVDIFRSVGDAYACYGMISDQHIVSVQCFPCLTANGKHEKEVPRPPLSCVYKRIYRANTLSELENILGVLGRVNIDCAVDVCQFVVNRTLDLEDYYLGERNADIRVVVILDHDTRISAVSSISHAE